MHGREWLKLKLHMGSPLEKSLGGGGSGFDKWKEGGKEPMQGKNGAGRPAGDSWSPEKAFSLPARLAAEQTSKKATACLGNRH